MPPTRTVRTFPFGDVDALDVHPTFDDVREQEPLCRVELPYGGEGWLVTRYDDVRTANSDPRFTRRCPHDDPPRTTALARRGDTILSMDAPEHSRLRRLVSRGFTARRVAGMEPWVSARVTELVDTLAESGPPADVVEGLAMPLTLSVICELLGVPYSDRADFREWCDRIMCTTAYTREEVTAADTQLRGYLGELIAARRARPDRYDDVLATLVLARDREDRLTEDELVTFGVTLLAAGHETTACQLANFVYVLLTHPDQLAIVRADPARHLPRAIEELLRFVPMGNGIGNARIAAQDVELSGGTVRAGEAVFAANVNANRDPRVFTDPERLDVTREDNPHLAFGHGPHFCLGAQLGRLELRLALAELLTRFPGLALVRDPQDVPWRTGFLFRSPAELEVTW